MTAKAATGRKPAPERDKEEAELDEALEETFPASDPPAPVQPHPEDDPEEAPDKPAG